jgi:hypothetical protein
MYRDAYQKSYSVDSVKFCVDGCRRDGIWSEPCNVSLPVLGCRGRALTGLK